jgi:hypothetical protein
MLRFAGAGGAFTSRDAKPRGLDSCSGTSQSVSRKQHHPPLRENGDGGVGLLARTNFWVFGVLVGGGCVLCFGYPNPNPNPNGCGSGRAEFFRFFWGRFWAVFGRKVQGKKWPSGGPKPKFETLGPASGRRGTAGNRRKLAREDTGNALSKRLASPDKILRPNGLRGFGRPARRNAQVPGSTGKCHFARRAGRPPTEKKFSEKNKLPAVSAPHCARVPPGF